MASVGAPIIATVFVVRLKAVRRIFATSWLFHFPALFLTLHLIVGAILTVYRLERGFGFDFYFLWYNLADAYKVIEALGVLWLLPVVLVSTAVTHAAVVVFLRNLASAKSCVVSRGPKWAAAVLSLVGIVAFAVAGLVIENETVELLAQLFRGRPEAGIVYYTHHLKSIDANRRAVVGWDDSASTLNLFLVHLESLSGELVSSNITPQLVRIANREGILLPRVQASSVLTIRAQETLLCSIPPALRENVASSPRLMQGLMCLPNILRGLGYRTLFFQTFPDVRFANRHKFLPAIGFEEVLGHEIMKPHDQRSRWGYREDVFYQRVLEYLRNFKGQRILAYLEASMSNHYDFSVGQTLPPHSELRARLPFPQPTNFRERLANTTFIQDHFFGQMFEAWVREGYANDSVMVIFGDHSWPIGMHSGNVFNENFAYQENFVSSLAFVLPPQMRGQYPPGQVIGDLYGHIDLMPTVLEILGVQGVGFAGKSFAEALRGKPEAVRDRCIVSVQPFAGGYIALVRFPHKYIFELRRNLVTLYDLRWDPNEYQPLYRRRTGPQEIALLATCLNQTG